MTLLYNFNTITKLYNDVIILLHNDTIILLRNDTLRILLYNDSFKQ